MSEKQIQIDQISGALSYIAVALVKVRHVKAGGMSIQNNILDANAALGVAQRALGGALELLLPLDEFEMVEKGG